MVDIFIGDQAIKTMMARTGMAWWRKVIAA
ncbi:MAG TPA: hypothetical protein DDZ24_10160 [Planctomycetaceae bacterium]|nr:hypothetical protein [Planctomycetaceae bacterium]